jgi:hypothetical protein
MDQFARRDAGQRLNAIIEAASRLDLPASIIEKDFWVCWTLRRLSEQPDLGGHMTFKGGTSLSKVYGVIERFSEDIDLTIARSAPFIRDTVPPMEPGITGGEVRRRTDALIAAAERYIAEIVQPQLEAAIAAALGTKEGWHISVDDADKQTLLFHYPRLASYGQGYGRGGYGAGRFGEGEIGYIKPAIKLEFGARGETDPHEVRTFTPYLANVFPDLLPDAQSSFPTLDAERTFWEKATLLHSLYHTGKIRERLSRHYYDIHMLAVAGIAEKAIAQPDLLAQVVRNKSIMFKEVKASYDTAIFGSMQLLPTKDGLKDLRSDYAAMAEMFMATPPSFDEVVATIRSLEARINGGEI